MSYTNDGTLAGPLLTWKTAFVSGPPPTISMCTTALIRFAQSGFALRIVTVPSISGGHTKRIVRAGRGIVPAFIKLDNATPTSSIVAHPLALSFAPGFG